MLSVEVIAHYLVVQVGNPVDLDCAGDMALVVQQNIFIALDDELLEGLGPYKQLAIVLTASDSF